MPMRPKFLHKVLALVLVPLSVTVGYTAFSYVRLAGDVSEELQRRQSFMNALFDLDDIYSNTLQTVSHYFENQRHAPTAEYINSRERMISKDLDEIKRAFDPSDQTALHDVDELAAYIKASFVKVDQALIELQYGNKLSALRKLGDLHNILPDFSDQFRALHRILNDRMAGILHESKEKFDACYWFLKVSLSTELSLICIALLWAALVQRYFESRMRVLKDNVHRLVKEQPLIPMDENDEFGDYNRWLLDGAAALEAVRKQREELDRLKQEFVAMVSHDLRTPLTSIQLFANMLAKGMLGEVNDKIKDKAQAADRNASRLIKLINDLLDMEKLGSGQLVLDWSEQTASSLVDRSVEAVRAFCDKSGVKIEVTECGAITFSADGDRIVQVLVNLLGNAVKFSPQGSTVSLTVEDGENYVTFRVKDEGRGVPVEMQSTIFERFKQVDAKDAAEKQGSGLGLAICKAIVDQHGGKIGVQSEPGKGSTFWFTIAKAKQPSPAIA